MNNECNGNALSSPSADFVSRLNDAHPEIVSVRKLSEVVKGGSGADDDGAGFFNL